VIYSFSLLFVSGPPWT